MIFRIVVNSVALWVAARLVDGIELSSSLWSVIVTAAIFGLINALLKPFAILLSLPLLILTLGLFTVVVNAAMLAVTDALSGGISIDGFRPAIWGAVIVSLVSWFASAFESDDDRKPGKRVSQTIQGAVIEGTVIEE